jgi:hypothetical protein
MGQGFLRLLTRFVCFYLQPQSQSQGLAVFGVKLPGL